MEINLEVGQHSLEQVNRINEKLVRQALQMLKSNKRDALFDMQSYCIKRVPQNL